MTGSNIKLSLACAASFRRYARANVSAVRQPRKIPMKHPLLKAAVLAAVLVVTTPTTQAGWLKRYIYNDISGGERTNLLNGTNSLGR